VLKARRCLNDGKFDESKIFLVVPLGERALPLSQRDEIIETNNVNE
jgi:hypothetical protein